MAKVQRCVMCDEELYKMTNYGEPEDGAWPPMVRGRAGQHADRLPHCEAEHVTFIDTTPGHPPVRRIRMLKPWAYRNKSL